MTGLNSSKRDSTRSTRSFGVYVRATKMLGCDTRKVFGSKKGAFSSLLDDGGRLALRASSMRPLASIPAEMMLHTESIGIFENPLEFLKIHWNF